jgi:hypothetical protein
MNAQNFKARIALLEKKQDAIRARLSAEHAKNRRRIERETARVVELVGKAVIDLASQNPGFSTMLKSVLGPTITDERARDLLRRYGVL